MPSPRPTKPRCSVVVAFSPTRETSTPMASARRARIRSRYGDRRGAWAATVQSQSRMRQPLSRHAREQPAGVRPRVGRVVVGKQLADVAGTQGPEDGIHKGVGDDIGIRVAQQATLAGHLDTRQDETAPLGEGVDVEAVPDPQHGEAPSRPPRISGPQPSEMSLRSSRASAMT